MRKSHQNVQIWGYAVSHSYRRVMFWFCDAWLMPYTATDYYLSIYLSSKVVLIAIWCFGMHFISCLVKVIHVQSRFWSIFIFSVCVRRTSSPTLPFSQRHLNEFGFVFNTNSWHFYLFTFCYCWGSTKSASVDTWRRIRNAEANWMNGWIM